MQVRATGCVALAAGAVVLALGSGIGWFWSTVPPSWDPIELPFSVLAPPAPAFERIVAEGRELVRGLISSEKLPSLSLAVSVEGNVVWAEALGWADFESNRPATPETLYRIGATSVCLTSALVGTLVESGEFDLDAMVQEYVPSFPRKEWPLHARELMAHTSGLRGLDREAEIFRSDGCADDEQRLRAFAGDPLRFAPGTERARSPYGWVLVGAMVGGAGGAPYLELLQERVLGPLGLDHTVPDHTDELAEQRARAYFPRFMLDPRNGWKDAPKIDLSCTLPAQGFVSTPRDLVRFGAALLDGTLLSRETVEELWAPVPVGSSVEEALGWTVTELALRGNSKRARVVGQGMGEAVRRASFSAIAVGGHVPGGTTTLLLVPEFGIAVAVSTNISGAGSVSYLASRLAELVVRRR